MRVAQARYGGAATRVEIALAIRIDDLDARRRSDDGRHGAQIPMHQSGHRELSRAAIACVPIGAGLAQQCFACAETRDDLASAARRDFGHQPFDECVRRDDRMEERARCRLEQQALAGGPRERRQLRVGNGDDLGGPACRRACVASTVCREYGARPIATSAPSPASTATDSVSVPKLSCSSTPPPTSIEYRYCACSATLWQLRKPRNATERACSSDCAARCSRSGELSATRPSTFDACRCSSAATSGRTGARAALQPSRPRLRSSPSPRRRGRENRPGTRGNEPNPSALASRDIVGGTTPARFACSRSDRKHDVRRMIRRPPRSLLQGVRQVVELRVDAGKCVPGHLRRFAEEAA